MSNYTKNDKERNPEIEKMALDILDCALMNAERAVQIMKKKEKNKQEGEMMKVCRELPSVGKCPLNLQTCACVFFLNKYRKQRLGTLIPTLYPIRSRIHTSNFIAGNLIQLT